MSAKNPKVYAKPKTLVAADLARVRGGDSPPARDRQQLLATMVMMGVS